jgi:hypothetical protein
MKSLLEALADHKLTRIVDSVESAARKSIRLTSDKAGKDAHN